MSKIKRTIISAARSSNTDLGRVVGQSLQKLREFAGLTQKDLARRLKIGQAAISKIEHRGDMQVSSLQKYVEAIGASLRIEAAFDPATVKDLPLTGVFEREIGDENQLVFPVFGDDLFQPRRDVVLSVRPQYSDKIFQGIKTVELRRRFPIAAPRGITAYIYSTSPVQAMVGTTEIKDVIKAPVSELWKKFGKKAQIERADFEEYFSGLKEGFALQIANARTFTRPIDLTELRERFGFEPPQSFLYATPVLRMALNDERPDVSH